MPTLTFSQAKAKAANHRNAFPGATKSVKFTKAEIQEVMNQLDCGLIEIYFALDDEGQPDERTLIVCGLDSDNETLPVLKGGTWICPPNCSEGGLNS